MIGSMSIALCFGWVLSFAGQTSTHRLHPVQSSGATCTVYFQPGYSFPFQSVDLKLAGAPANSLGS